MARKSRGHGQGHLYSASGKWYVRYREDVIQPDGTVKHVQLSSPPLATIADVRGKIEARRLADEYLASLRGRTLTPQATMAIGQFVEKVYLPFVEKQREPSTLQGYKQIWKAYLQPRIASVRLRDFQTFHGERLMQEIADAHELSHTTLAHIKAMLSAVFKYAKQQGFLSGVNPIQDVSTPRGVETEDTPAYSLEDELQMLLLLPSTARAVVATAAFTGLSKSELRGLHRDDYDGEQIRVQRKAWKGHIGPPKTKARKGAVPVIRPLAKILDAHVQTLLSTSPYLFPSVIGTPLNLDNLARRVIRPLIEACITCGKKEAQHGKDCDHEYRRNEEGLCWRGWHAFRRGLATNLHQLGIDDKTIQALLRHGDVQTTQRNYIKTVSTSAVAAMQTLERMLEQKEGTLPKSAMN